MRRVSPFGGAALLLVLFALVVMVVVAGGATATDRAILAALRVPGEPHVADVPRWVIAAARVLTHGGDFPVRACLALIAAIVLFNHRYPRAAWALILAVPGAALLVELGKAITMRARPDIAWRLARAHGASFPSGHAEGAMVTYPLLALFLGALVGPRWVAPGVMIGIALALAIGSTRVLLGAHWASDVAAGWLLGGAVACVAACADRPGR